MKPMVQYGLANMSDTFHIKNGLKQGHASSQLVFNFA